MGITGSRSILGVGITLALLVVVAASFAAPAQAEGSNNGGHGSKTSSTISLELLNGDSATHYGGQVTFDVSTTATDQPFVELDCYQGGVWVYWSSAGFFDTYPWQWAQDFTLRSDNWTGGAANCTAQLYYLARSRTRTLATISFDVTA